MNHINKKEIIHPLFYQTGLFNKFLSFLIYFIYICYIIINNMKLTFEENSALIDVEATLKMLSTADNLRPYQKEWVKTSLTNISNFRYQNS